MISTYGRGFCILDDITPLQQMTPQVLASDAHLFPTRAAYRFRPITAPSTTYDDPTVGENPKYGASINYYLKSAPTGPVTVTILDAKNQVVRTLPGTRRAGLNRVYWDLRNDPSLEARLRTNPLYAPQAQFRPGPDGTRPAQGAGQITLLMPPGTYSVKLSVGGKDQTQPLTVRKDPNSEGTDADIEAQTRLLTELRGHANVGAAMVNQIELIRSQLDLLDRLGADAATKTAVNELTKQLIDTEMNLVDLRQTGTGQDGVRFGSKLLSKINYLANGVAGSDFKPTDQHLAVEKLIATQLKEVQSLVDALRGRILGGFNDQLKGKGLPPIVVPPPK